MNKYGSNKKKAGGILSDVLDGAKILDNYVVSKDVRVKMGLYKKDDSDEKLLDFDRSFGTEKSLLQILVAFLGVITAIAFFAMMRKIRRAEKEKMKKKLRMAKVAAKDAAKDAAKEAAKKAE